MSSVYVHGEGIYKVFRSGILKNLRNEKPKLNEIENVKVRIP